MQLLGLRSEARARAWASAERWASSNQSCMPPIACKIVIARSVDSAPSMICAATMTDHAARLLLALFACLLPLEIMASESALDRLGSARGNRDIELQLARLEGTNVGLRVREIDVRASDVRVEALIDGRSKSLANPSTRNFVGRSEHGEPVAITLDAQGKVYSAILFGHGGDLIIDPSSFATPTLRGRLLADALPAGVEPNAVCGVAGNSQLRSRGFDVLRAPRGNFAPPARNIEGAIRQALIAVDTDTEFMALKFSDNTTAALTWIDSIFTAMTAIYEADAGTQLRLVRGTTRIRIGSDPFNNTDFPASGNTLTEFGNVWAATEGGTTRVNAMLLSGKSASPNSAAGIAWVNSYCENQSLGGSYSVNQVFKFTPASATVALDTRIVAHELGHNFGAEHTHCTDTNPGAPGLQPIDQCFNAEAGCYSGPVSCPGGPGTLMSYCNFGAPSGAGCGQNNLVLAPTHSTLLGSQVSANFPNCITPLGHGGDLIFRNGFQVGG